MNMAVKVKVLLGYIYPTSNAKSLACDTANEHALTCTRETCSCIGANGDDLYRRRSSLGSTIQTVN